MVLGMEASRRVEGVVPATALIHCASEFWLNQEKFPPPACYNKAEALVEDS